eukprot:s4784_g8.t4
MVEHAVRDFQSALQQLNAANGKPASFGCSANCQICAQLVLENNSPVQTGAGSLWSQRPTLYFDFDELDEEEIGRPSVAATVPSEGPATSTRRLFEGTVTLQIVAAMTGVQVCSLVSTALNCTIWDVKERIERKEGTKLSAQKLLCANGQVAHDDAILADVVDHGQPELSLVRSPPVWAGLLASIAAGEVQLEELDEGARSDRAIVLAAVHASQGRALAHASPTLRGDKELVTEAVKRNGLSLRHASSSLRADRDIVLTAIRECPLALEFASDALRKDHDFIVNAVRVSARAAGCVTEELQRNGSFAGELLAAFPAVFAHLPPQLRRSREFVLRAVRCNGDVLRFAAGWHSHPEVALTAVQKAPQAVHFVDASLRQTPEFATAAVMVNPWVFEQLGSQHRNDLVLALQAARAQPALAHFAGENIKSEVLTRIQKEQSEAFGAPEGYVDGPVWWLPETLKYKHKAAQEMVKQLCLVSFEAHGRPHAHVQTRLHTQHEAVLEAFLDRHVDYADISSNSQECSAWSAWSVASSSHSSSADPLKLRRKFWQRRHHAGNLWFQRCRGVVCCHTYSCDHGLGRAGSGHAPRELCDISMQESWPRAGPEDRVELCGICSPARLEYISLLVNAWSKGCGALCCTEDQWSKALQWLGEAKKAEVPLAGVYTAVMSVARRARCWHVALPLLEDMQQSHEAPDRKFFNSALWSCSRGHWEVSIQLLHRMASDGVPSEPFTYFAAAQEHPDQSTACCMVQQLWRMRRHSLQVDICQFAKMLAHYASDAEWPVLREAVLEDGGFLLPLRRRLMHTFAEDISWYQAHARASKELTRQWLDLFPETQYENWRRLRKKLKKLRRPDPLDYSNLGAHAGYIRNKVFEKDRCAQVACVLFGPEAVMYGLTEKESCVVVDIGGGPGIAALGIAVYAGLEGWPVHLEHHVIDCEDAWSQTILRLQEVLQLWHSEADRPRTDLYFHQGQLLSKKLVTGVPSPEDTDVFLFSYVLHENVEALRSRNFGLLSTLLQAARPGAIFLFLDVEDTLWSEIAALAASLGRFMVQLQQFRKDDYWLVLQNACCENCSASCDWALRLGMGKAGAKAEPKKDAEKGKAGSQKDGKSSKPDPKVETKAESGMNWLGSNCLGLESYAQAQSSSEGAPGLWFAPLTVGAAKFAMLKLFKGEVEVDAVMKDIDGVDASKYVSELTECILEAAGNSLKLKELSSVSKICSRLNATYEEFGNLLGRGLLKAGSSESSLVRKHATRAASKVCEA